MEEQGYVKMQVEDGLGIIEFFHPAHNALPGKLLSQLAQAIKEAGVSSEIRVVLLKSGGNRTFCAGASFDELQAIRTPEEGKAFFMGFARVIQACRQCRKIIIGRVQGKAVGGGVGLAAATDYCLATQYAAIRLSELALGIGPFVVGPAIKRKLGLSAFTTLCLQPQQWQSAEWAAQHGLYQTVYPSTEALDEAIAQLAHQLLQYNPDALAHIKEMLWYGTDSWNTLLEKRAEISGALILSDFSRHAIQRIKTKTK